MENFPALAKNNTIYNKALEHQRTIRNSQMNGSITRKPIISHISLTSNEQSTSQQTRTFAPVAEKKNFHRPGVPESIYNANVG